MPFPDNIIEEENNKLDEELVLCAKEAGKRAAKLEFAKKLSSIGKDFDEILEMVYLLKN